MISPFGPLVCEGSVQKLKAVMPDARIVLGESLRR